MNKLDELKSLLGHYEHLFQNVHDYKTDARPCMDVALELINDADYYGVNCTGDQQLYMLFFTGSSDYFPGVWIGNDDIDNIDQMPVYILDFSNSDCNDSESCGNIKQYVTQILDEILACEETSQTDKNYATELKTKLKKFSDNVIDKGNYKLSLADEQ